MIQLDDDSKLWFGKFKNQPLGEIPASYLLWLWDDAEYWNKLQGTELKSALHEYLKSAIPDLLEERPDYILQHKP